MGLSSSLHPTKLILDPVCPSEPRAVGIGSMQAGGGSSESSGHPRVLLSISCARQQGVPRDQDPFFAPSPFPGVSLSFLVECGVSRTVVWPARPPHSSFSAEASV